MRAIPYVIRRNLASMSWLVPMVIFVVAVASTTPGSAPFGGTLAVGGMSIFAFATWLGLVAINSEDPGHQTVLAAICGGRLRLRFGQLAAAGIVVLPAITATVVVAAIRSSAYPSSVAVPVQLSVAAATLAAAAVAGLAVAFSVSWPVVLRSPISVVVALVTAVVLVVLPWSPLHIVLQVQGRLDSELRLGSLLLGLGGTLVLAGLLVASASWLVVRRWRPARD